MIDQDVRAHDRSERCIMCNRELIGVHDHGVKVVPPPKGPRPVEILKSIYPVWYAASIQAHIDEEIRLADRITELIDTIKALRAEFWPNAILEHHYGGSKNKPHNKLMAGDLVETCTEGYCPDWWKLYKKAGKVI